MKDGRLCTIDNCYFANRGAHEKCVTVAQVDRLIVSRMTACCAGCSQTLSAHLFGPPLGHRFFERWGEQDETWSAEVN